MANDPLRTVLVERLGCRYPIIQTAMGWVSEPALVTASIEAGAFGFLAAAVMTPKEAAAKIAAIRAATARPFGVNFHMFQPRATEIVDLILANRDQIRAVSFGRGPDKSMIARFRQAGILCIPTVGALKHAQKMQDLGVDMITVQGGEGGGHTGSVPTTILLPQVLDAVRVPVIAAGGMADGRALAVALAYGAAGIAMGTRFLMTRESPVADAAKTRYQKAGTDDIVLTTKLDGLPHRMLRTDFVDRLTTASPLSMWLRAFECALAMKRHTGASWSELLQSARDMQKHGAATLPQALLAAAVPTLIRRAIIEGQPENGVMATGLVAGRLADLPTCRELVDRIVTDAQTRIAALTGANPIASAA
jgi:NAD(P)H-dependent flavin oxidoreductase YrpB (nitropropane dioxygenase family)